MQRSHPAAKRYDGDEDGRENESHRTVPPLSRFRATNIISATQAETSLPTAGAAPEICSTMRLALGSSVLSGALTCEPQTSRPPIPAAIPFKSWRRVQQFGRSAHGRGRGWDGRDPWRWLRSTGAEEACSDDCGFRNGDAGSCAEGAQPLAGQDRRRMATVEYDYPS
jgi:hypothetical protein